MKNIHQTWNWDAYERGSSFFYHSYFSWNNILELETIEDLVILQIITKWFMKYYLLFRSLAFLNLLKKLKWKKILLQAWQLWNERSLLELMDSSINDNYSRHQIFRCIQVGLLCVQQSAADRPTMSEVISFLSNETMPLPAPNEPAFVNQKNTIKLDAHNNESSANNVTCTMMEPR